MVSHFYYKCIEKNRTTTHNSFSLFVSNRISLVKKSLSFTTLALLNFSLLLSSLIYWFISTNHKRSHLPCCSGVIQNFNLLVCGSCVNIDLSWHWDDTSLINSKKLSSSPDCISPRNLSQTLVKDRARLLLPSDLNLFLLDFLFWNFKYLFYLHFVYHLNVKFSALVK